MAAGHASAVESYEVAADRNYFLACSIHRIAIAVAFREFVYLPNTPPPSPWIGIIELSTNRPQKPQGKWVRGQNPPTKGLMASFVLAPAREMLRDVRGNNETNWEVRTRSDVTSGLWIFAGS